MRKRIHWYFLSLLITFTSAILVFSSAELFSQDSIADQEQLEMPEEFRSTLIIAYDDDLAPLSYAADGRIRGVLVDILNEILVVRLGKQVEHRGYSWKRAQLMVRADNADALCAVPGSARQHYVLFTSSPVVVSSPAIFSGVNNPRKSDIEAIGTIDGLRAFSLVDHLGSSWSRDTLPRDIQKNINWVGSLDTVLKMIAINRYDIYLGDGIVGRYGLINLGLADAVLARPVPIGTPTRYHFAMRKNHPDAPTVVNDVQRELKRISDEGMIERMVQGYISPVIIDNPQQ